MKRLTVLGLTIFIALFVGGVIRYHNSSEAIDSLPLFWTVIDYCFNGLMFVAAMIAFAILAALAVAIAAVILAFIISFIVMLIIIGLDTALKPKT